MTVLSTYTTSVDQLLHNQNGTLYLASDLTSYINRARKQIAMEGACIRGLLSFSAQVGVKAYPFSGFTIPPSVGWASVVTVRQVYGATPVASRPWEWYAQFMLTSSTTGASATTWAQFLPGTNGNLYLYPVPSATPSYMVDCVVIPIDLVTDADVEALPYPWTDAVVYYACYLALSGVSRAADADRMWGLYQRHMQRARDTTVPSQLPRNFPLSGQISGVPTNTPPISSTPPGGPQGA